MRHWRRPVLLILGATAIADMLMAALDMGPHLPLVTAAGVLVIVALWFIVGLSSVATGDENLRTELAFAPQARHDRRVTQLQRGIAYSRSDEPLERLRVELIALIDDQLRATHDIDRTRNPDQAVAVLGPELDRFVNDDSTATSLARPRSLDRILTLIEQL